MAVLPINSVSVNTNHYTFTGRNDKKDSHKANPLASVPVIVMLAMAPMAEGKQPAQFVPIDSEHLTEVLAQANATTPKTYAYTQAPQKEAPLGIKYLLSKRAQKIISCYGNKQPAKLLLTTGRNDNENRVTRIYYIQDNYDKNQYKEPPYIQSLIYHDLGKDSFLGIKTVEYLMVYKDDDYELKKFVSEIKLDDKSAQYLIDFLTGDTNFKNSTEIKYEETTNPRVQPPKVY